MRTKFIIVLVAFTTQVYAQFNNRLLESSVPVYHSTYQNIIDYAKANAIDIPSPQIQLIQNDFFEDIDPLISKGVVGYIFAGDATRRSFSYLNIFSPGNFTITDGVQPSYSAKGVAGNGTTQYLRTHWNPSTDGGSLFTLNDCSIATFLNSDVSGAMLDYGANDGTRQLIMNARASTPSNTIRFIVNANTNLDVAANVISPGLYIATRTSSSAANMWKDGVVNNFASTTSLALPNAEMYLLARNSSGSANNFSSRSMGFWMAFDGLTSGEKLILRNAWLHYYNKQQDPLFVVTDDPVTTDALVPATPAAWDSNQVFGIAMYPNPLQDPDGPDFLYYGGNNSVPGDGRPNNVGVFNLTTPSTGSKDVSNPVLLRTAIGLSASTQGFAPMSAWAVGSTVYLFGSVYESTNSEINIGYVTTTTSNPKVFSSPSLTRVLTAGGTGHFNHGCSVFPDPNDPDILLMAYAHRNTSSDVIKINIAEADISDLSTWTIRHTNIWSSSLAGSGQVYPYVIWDDIENKYYLFCGRFSSVVGGDYFTIFSTESTDLSSFPEGRETLWPTGGSTDFDGGYTSVPRPDLARGKIYYCGRDLSGSDGSYIGIGVRNIVIDSD